VAERDIYTLFGDIADAVSYLGDVLLNPEGDGERHSYSFEIPQSVKHYIIFSRPITAPETTFTPWC